MNKLSRPQHTTRSKLIAVCLSLAGTAAAMVPLAAAAAPRYSVIELEPLINRERAYVADINNAGVITGTSYTGANYESQAFVYNNGITTNLGPVGSTGKKINNAGAVIGEVNQTAAIFKNGTIQYLEQSDDFTSYAGAFNDHGQVVGRKSFGPNQFGGFLYQNGVMSDFNLPLSDRATAEGINNAGQIAGNASFGAFLYHNGSYPELVSPLGADSWTVATGLNDNGDVIGRFSVGEMTSRGFVYKNGSMIDMGTLPDRWDSSPSDINNLGQIVGYAHNDSYHRLAFIYENSVMTDLNSLIDPTDGYELAYANAINDVGQILATRCDPDWMLPCQQVLLNPIISQTPVPEPGSTSMLLAGLALVGVYQRRKHGKSVSRAA